MSLLMSFYTLYSDMGKTDFNRYALAHFQININYKYTAAPHGNCKKSRKPYLKTMSSTIESLKYRRLARNRSQHILTQWQK